MGDDCRGRRLRRGDGQLAVARAGRRCAPLRLPDAHASTARRGMAAWLRRFMLCFAATLVSHGVLAAAGAAGLLLLGAAAAVARAAPITPTNDLPLSSSVQHTISRPAGQTWFYTGGTYNPADPAQMWAARNDGVLERYQVAFTGSNVTGASLLGYHNTGLSGLADVVATPDGYVAVAGTNVYLLNPDFSIANTISMSTSDLTDAHVYTTLDPSANVSGLDYAIVLATMSDNIRRLTDLSGGSVEVASGATYSVGGMDLGPYYLHNLLTIDGEFFKNYNHNGGALSGATFVEMNNSGIIMGDTFGQDFFAEYQFDRIDLHNQLDVQDSQILVPEPTSIVLLGLGGLALVFKRRKSGLLVPEYHQD